MNSSAGGQQPDRGLPRREFLAASGALTLAGSLASAESRPANGAAEGPGIIAAENALPGTSDWMLTKCEVDPETKYRSPWIEGFASRTSVRAGESIQLCQHQPGIAVSDRDLSDGVLRRIGWPVDEAIGSV